MSVTEVALITCFLIAHFLWLRRIACRMLGLSSDHCFYIYYVELIRENRRRFLFSFPNLLNFTPTVDPQYFYWLLSYVCPPKGLLAMSRVVNPAMSVGLLLLFYLFLLHLPYDSVSGVSPSLLVVMLALNPQSMHVTNTRNYGLNTRGAGLLLFSVLALFSYQAEADVHLTISLSGAAVAAWLIIGTNIFAFQTALFFSVLMGILFGYVFMGLAILMGVGIFFCLHPTYAIHYFRYLISFWRLYSEVVADRFILMHRYSIWRDWVRDFWGRLRVHCISALFYIYGNPSVVVLVLSPMTLLSPLALVRCRATGAEGGFVVYSAQVCVVALAVFLITSFRRTRFLGEPERYVEMAAPFAVVAGAHVIKAYGGAWGLGAYVAYAAGMTFVQGWYNFFRDRSTKEGSQVKESIQSIRDEVDRLFGDAEVRFISNNGDWTKMLLNTRWRFVYYWPTVREVGGIPLQEFMDSYPMIKRTAIERLIAAYKVNACLMDKREVGTLVEPNLIAGSMSKVLLESDRYVLYRLDRYEVSHAG